TRCHHNHFADGVVDRPGYHHPDDHQGLFQIFFHGSFLSVPSLSGLPLFLFGYFPVLLQFRQQTLPELCHL
ncbi:MAG: hypothetical protein J6W44_05985, partial [Oscillospiraceae bacterium]|nr:hypothetical protein [Oscillospiraceae bacterium]